MQKGKNTNKITLMQNIIWFSSPYNNEMKTKIGAICCKWINVCKNSKLFQIIDSNINKIIYICVEIWKNIINKHSKNNYH